MNAKEKIYPKLAKYCADAVNSFNDISDERKIILNDLASYTLNSIKSQEVVNLNFICTHNSRRSHMAQLWAAAAAEYYGIKSIQSFSGGTEATAFNKNAIDAMERAGFQIIMTHKGNNPVYEAMCSTNSEAHKMWSKKFDDPLNPSEHFAAVMVCSDADENCPFIPGATRISMPFDDPKAFDGNPSESAKYDGRCFQIATEILYVMHQVKMTP